MLKRKASEKIIKWIKYGKNALLVSGARQVGKTFIIRECLKSLNCNYLEINLIEKPFLVNVFAESNSVTELELNLSLAVGYVFKKNESIIFIDEVQQCKDILTKIKFWVDEGSYKYILSGSLLGIELNDLRSVPVGYLDEIQMFPLDFQEFLWASDITDKSISYLNDCFMDEKPVSDTVHSVMLRHFRKYLIIGGMPAAVYEYFNTNNISEVYNIQENVIFQYKRDFTKYEMESKKLILKNIYDLIPSQLLKQNRRFIYANLKKGLKAERMEDSFLWLDNAGVIISVYNSTEPKIPLLLNKKSSLIKLYYSDIGLLTCMYGKNLKLDLLLDTKKINYGGVYENAVAQELYAHGYKLYFYNSHKLGEIDFLLENMGKVLPLEIKSGKDYTFHSALNNLLNIKDFEIDKAIVFNNYNVTVKDKTVYFPVYMCMFL